MKLVHNIMLTVFVKPKEDENKIAKALTNLIPLEIEKEKIKMHKTVAEGLVSSKIIILEITLEKERHTTKMIEFLKTKLTQEDLDKLRNQDNRIDEECTFFLRLDKKKALEQIYELTDGGECFHIKMSIAAFPKKREVAVELAKKIFS